MSDRLRLPDALRGELKRAMGRLFTGADALATAAGRPLVAVGDIVTYHLLEAGHRPDVAVVDDRTERAAVDPEVAAAITGFDRELAVANPPGTLTRELVGALADGLDADGSVLIAVDGEEDLAALAAIVGTPPEGSVVYGQPGEGMVLVDPGERAGWMREFLGQMDGDTATVLGPVE